MHSRKFFTNLVYSIKKIGSLLLFVALAYLELRNCLVLDADIKEPLKMLIDTNCIKKDTTGKICC